ncbi:MAG: hypothetical protein M0Z77_11430 [Thermoplasmatales archaeon]|nr:hypothetical protein [Thermoplasmatales archaeon]
MEHLSSIDDKGLKVSKFYGDGAFDQFPVFNKFHLLKARPIIKIRKNASADWYYGSKHQRRGVREYKDLGYKRWAELNGYDMSWPSTEGIFSAVKHKFGENTVPRSEEGLLAEGYQRF